MSCGLVRPCGPLHSQRRDGLSPPPSCAVAVGNSVADCGDDRPTGRGGDAPTVERALSDGHLRLAKSGYQSREPTAGDRLRGSIHAGHPVLRESVRGHRYRRPAARKPDDSSADAVRLERRGVDIQLRMVVGLPAWRRQPEAVGQGHLMGVLHTAVRRITARNLAHRHLRGRLPGHCGHARGGRSGLVNPTRRTNAGCREVFPTSGNNVSAGTDEVRTSVLDLHIRSR